MFASNRALSSHRDPERGGAEAVAAGTSAPPDPAPAHPARVVVCVAAYRRPLMLRALLASLGELRFPGPPPRIDVVVADNDEGGSARAVVEGCRPALPFPVHYVAEPQRNIALARNRGVAEALRLGADWVAFVDDDETVSPGWLARLLQTQGRHGADVVGGAVTARLADTAPRYLSRGAFFGMPAWETGERLTIAFTNNVLVRAVLLAGVDGPFRHDFGLSGGSDSHLFMLLHRRGARMVWDAEAVVEEQVPLSRQSARWVLRRAFRVGNVAVRCERVLGPLGRPATRLAKASARLALGAALLLPSLALGRARTLRALCNVSYGMGALAATFGYRYLEYQSVHGE